jgi:hypothetical protein
MHNHYFHAVFRRNNVIKTFILDSALKIASYPRLIIEVFIRRNFGRRYFKLSSVITVTFLLFFVPFLMQAILSFSASYNYEYQRQVFWQYHRLYYFFIPVFLGFGIYRWFEMKRNKSRNDFNSFSLYTGDRLLLFDNLIVTNKRITDRLVDTIIEPAPFVIVGIILMLFNQRLGDMLFISGLLYGLSYAAQYKIGDDFIMDKTDEIILNEEMENVFVNDQKPDKSRGVRFYTTKPDSKSLRRKLVSTFAESEKVKEEVTYAE